MATCRRPAAMPAGSGLRRAWIRACVVGELIGFFPPAVTGATLAALGASDGLMVIGLTSAGLLEGAALGIAQARVLRRHMPAVDGRAWVTATTAAAGFAWFVGMGGASLLAADAFPTVVTLAVLVPAWAAALAAMGFGQWLVLRRVVTHSARWVPVTAAAWFVGVMLPIGALSLTPNAWPPWAFVAVGVAAAVAMGLTVGAITGSCLVRLGGTDRPSGRRDTHQQGVRRPDSLRQPSSAVVAPDGRTGAVPSRLP